MKNAPRQLAINHNYYILGESHRGCFINTLNSVLQHNYSIPTLDFCNLARLKGERGIQISKLWS